jgi:hypothetical protein
VLVDGSVSTLPIPSQRHSRIAASVIFAIARRPQCGVLLSAGLVLSADPV